MKIILTPDIAKAIVKRAMSILDYSINVMDAEGIIIASGDPTRLNQLHIGAVQALRQRKTIVIDEQLAAQWQHEVKPGINVPIVYSGKVLGVVGISGEPQTVSNYAKLVKMTAELIIEQAVQLERERWHNRYKEAFILQLVNGEADQHVLQQQAVFFHVDLTLARVAVIVHLQQPSAEQLQALMTYYAEEQQPAAILNQQQILLLKPLNLKGFPILPTDTETQHYRVAIGGYFEHKSGLAHSFQTAKTILAYGLRHYPRRLSYDFQQYKLPTLLAPFLEAWQSDDLRKMRAQLQSKDTKQVLLKTLQRYFVENCDPVRTSEKLFVHSNTLRYRLDKIEQLTGLSFNKIEDKFILYLLTIM